MTGSFSRLIATSDYHLKSGFFNPTFNAFRGSRQRSLPMTFHRSRKKKKVLDLLIHFKSRFFPPPFKFDSLTGCCWVTRERSRADVRSWVQELKKKSTVWCYICSFLNVWKQSFLVPQNFFYLLFLQVYFGRDFFFYLKQKKLLYTDVINI